MNDRSGSRPTFVIVGLLVLALLAGLLAWRMVARHHMESARESFQTTVKELRLSLEHPPEVPPADDTVRWLRAAAALVEGECIDAAVKPLVSRSTDTWTAAEVKAARQCLAANREVLDLLHLAARCPGSNWGLEYSLDAEIPPLLDLLRCARLLAVSGGLHLKGDDSQATLGDVAALATVARSLEGEKQLICPLVGVAVEKLLLGLVGEAAMAGGVGPEEAASIEALLPRRDPIAAGREALAVETTILTAMFLDPDSGTLEKGGLEPDTAWGRVAVTVGSVLGIPWREVLVADLYHMGIQRLQVMGVPYAHLADAPPRRMSHSFPVNLVVPEEVFGGFNTHVLAGRMQETMAWRHLVRAGLALIRQAGSTGSYPEVLPPGFEAPQLYCECSLELEHRPDGSAVLFLPGAPELSEKLWSWPKAAAPYPFRWELPPPAGGKGVKR